MKPSLPSEQRVPAFVDDFDTGQRIAGVLQSVATASRTSLAAESGVVAFFAVERISAESADQQVIAETTLERIVAHATDERVLAIAADQRVVAGLAGQCVVARSAIQSVVGVAAADRIFARTTQQRVVATAAGQDRHALEYRGINAGTRVRRRETRPFNGMERLVAQPRERGRREHKMGRSRFDDVVRAVALVELIGPTVPRQRDAATNLRDRL